MLLLIGSFPLNSLFIHNSYDIEHNQYWQLPRKCHGTSKEPMLFIELLSLGSKPSPHLDAGSGLWKVTVPLPAAPRRFGHEGYKGKAGRRGGTHPPYSASFYVRVTRQWARVLHLGSDGWFHLSLFPTPSSCPREGPGPRHTSIQASSEGLLEFSLNNSVRPHCSPLPFSLPRPVWPIHYIKILSAKITGFISIFLTRLWLKVSGVYFPI